MENKVIMSLNDYNALKRKADAFEQAVDIQIWTTWVDCNVNPKAIEPLVKAKIKEAIADGELDESTLRIKPTKDWLVSATIADVIKKDEQ